MSRYLKHITLFFILNGFLFAQERILSFDHFSIDEGLSFPVVKCILKDRYGLMWFGTENGLNSYDGYTFKQYKNNPEDPGSISYNFIPNIYEDRAGKLWIATRRGLCLYDRAHDKFIRYMHTTEDSTSLRSNLVLSIFEEESDGQTTLWVNTLMAMNRYNPQTDNFTRYDPEKEKYAINLNNVRTMVQDSSGRFWIATHHQGLFLYNREKDSFERYTVQIEYSNVFKNDNIKSLIATREKGEDFIYALRRYEGGLYKIALQNGNIKQIFADDGDAIQTICPDKNPVGKTIWMTSSNHLYRYDSETGEMNRLCKLPPAEIISLYHDDAGILWLGSDQGIFKINLMGNNFTTLNPKNLDPLTSTNNEVIAICQTGAKEGPATWIGTSNGLIRYDIENKSSKRFYHDPQNQATLSSNKITGILTSRQSSHEYLWVITEFGLNCMNLRTGHTRRYYIPEDDIYNSNIIWSICEDRFGQLWLGLGNSGLYRFDPQTETFTRYYGASQGISVLYADSFGCLWIGSMTGLTKFEMISANGSYVLPENFNNVITRYTHSKEDSGSISYDYILSIYEDSRNNLWIGTVNGLNMFDRNQGRFTRFNKNQGLPGEAIAAILEDEKGYLWISTDFGLARFNPINKSCKNYYSSDGLQSNLFYTAAFKNSMGRMFFAGINGITYFNPSEIKENRHIPPVILTDLRIFNKPVFPGSDSLLDKMISVTEEVKIPYDQTVFSFEFAALDYYNPEKNKYAYKMEGIDPDWVYTDASRRFATYTNLDPGEYIFRVKGSNNDGIWNEQGTSVRVIILPPWWRTKWAYSIYMVMVLAAVTGVYRFQSNRLRIQRQMEIREMQTEHLQEMDRIKSRFFTNISHEFRTPLTLIKGPLQQFLKNESNDNNKSQYKIMLRNTNRLLELVNQILDISKLDSGQMKLQVVETEIASLIKQIVLTFASHAESRKINMKFTCDEEEYNGYIDQDKFTKIITNLISNAFNHTPQDGKININLVRASASQNTQLKRNGLQITVANTGLGIPADQLDRIFDRFYRGSNGYSKDTEGSGIGLALVKELVELHHGRISVKSEISKETVFRIWLPIDQDSYLSEEIDTTYRPSIKFVISEKDTDLRETDFADASVINNNRPQILVVEDNSDVIRYIDHILNDEFRLTSAENGSEGLKLAIKMYPDLILSDVMMPEMDGFEFCRKIKSDERLSHIPVILLTAKADLNSKIEGLEFGADDYLCKPFEADELRTRIRNLIRQRQMLREKFSRMLEVNPAEVTATSLDEQFLDRVINVFENHIADPDMDTVRFARQVGLSRSQLNRKLLALTNQPTSKFLLSLRLKRAAQLIRQYAGNISEIAYMVGFNSLSHFSTKFREQFGESPRQFAKKTKQASTIKD